MRDQEGKIVVEDIKIKEVWREYFEKLLNEEFHWNRDTLDMDNEVHGPCEKFAANEIRAAISKIKSGKVAGPSGIVTEMLKAAGEARVLWVTDICNAVVSEGKIPSD